jgi:hypothetical protein
LSEGSLNERRHACTRAFGRCRQSRGHLFREVNAYSGFHDGPCAYASDDFGCQKGLGRQERDLQEEASRL